MDVTSTAQTETSSQDLAEEQTCTWPLDSELSMAVPDPASGVVLLPLDGGGRDGGESAVREGSAQDGDPGTDAPVADAQSHRQEDGSGPDRLAAAADSQASGEPGGPCGAIRELGESRQTFGGALSMPYLRAALARAIPGTPRLIGIGLAGVVGLLADRNFLRYIAAHGEPFDTSVITAASIVLVGTTILLVLLPSLLWTGFVEARRRLKAGPNRGVSQMEPVTAAAVAARVAAVVAKQTAPKTSSNESRAHHGNTHHGAHGAKAAEVRACKTGHWCPAKFSMDSIKPGSS
jgi:hypothetical protein